MHNPCANWWGVYIPLGFTPVQKVTLNIINPFKWNVISNK